MHKVCSAERISGSNGVGVPSKLRGNFRFTSAVHPHPQLSLRPVGSFIPAGLEADLFYVHEGAINTYAMHFTVPVPADVHELEFSWQSLIAYPVSNQEQSSRTCDN